MIARPRSITIIGWLFIAMGSVGLVYHLSELRSRPVFDYELAVIALIRLVAILSGIFLLRGANWARWLLVAWMAYHIGLSALHSLPELLMHVLIFGAVTCFLLRPGSSAYFRGAGPRAPESNS